MNPAYTFLISLGIGAAFWLGFWTGHDNSREFWPNGPAALLNASCIVIAVTSIVMMILQTLP